MANSQINGASTHAGCPSNGEPCHCDDTRAALLREAQALRLEPSRPSRDPGPIVIGGEVVDVASATAEQLMRAARAVRAQFKDVVERQRALLAKAFADSTATDGFKVKVRAEASSHGA